MLKLLVGRQFLRLSAFFNRSHFQTYFVLVFCAISIQAQTSTDEKSWIAVQQSLLELRKNYENVIGPNAEFGKRLDALIESVGSYIKQASKLFELFEFLF
jgi:hypothetical protein